MRINFDRFFNRSADVAEGTNPLLFVLAQLPFSVSPGGPWIAGGAVRKLVLKQPLNSDFDFFFSSQAQFSITKDALVVAGAKLLSSNAFNFTYEFRGLKIQLITTQYYPSLEACLDSFDFTLCQAGYDGTDLVFGEYALWDIGRKKLVPHKVSYGVASLRRIIKYTSQGFSMCSGSMTEFLRQAGRDDIIQSTILYID